VVVEKDRADRVKNEALQRVKEKSSILYTVKQRKANLIGPILQGNRVFQGRIEGNGRQGRSRKQLLDGLKNRRIFWKLKEEAQDLNL